MSTIRIQEISARLKLGARAQLRLAAVASPSIVAAVDAIAESLLKRGGKLLVFGNGGSAAEAQHFAAELIGRFHRERGPFPAIALTSDGAAVTAIGNDYGFADVFSRQVAGLGLPGDIAVAMSTSGQSENVLNAVRTAKTLGIPTVGLTGANGVELARLVDISIVVPSDVTSLIQEGHLAIVHTICAMLDDAILGPGSLFSAHLPTVLRWDQLDSLGRQWRDNDVRVVWTNGCFDLLHIGHLRSLEQASEFGDVLVVGVNGDESVRALKGPARPIVPAAQRAELVGGLKCVDHVVIFYEPTPIESLLRLRPAVHCKGLDYSPEKGGILPEAEAVASYGGRVEFLDIVDGVSTTMVVDRLA